MNKVTPKFALGIPTWGKASTDWAQAFSSLQFPLGSAMTPLWVKGEKIDDARNAICKQAIERGATHLGFISDDVLAPPNIWTRLLARNKPIVTGIYWTKTYPAAPYIWRGVQQGPFLNWKEGEFFQIDMAGCDALLLEVDVLKSIPYPWFNCNWTWEHDEKVGALSTEDFYFFTKAKAAGYEVWCDSGIQCLHEDRDNGHLFGMTVDMPQCNPEVEAKAIKRTNKICAEIGCGLTSEHYDGEIVRFDFDESVKPDVRCDIRNIPEPDDKFDDLRASHILQHIDGYEAAKAVAEWLRILKVGGTLKIRVPSFEWAARALLPETGATPEERMFARQIIYGETFKGAGFEHKNGFTENIMRNLFVQVGGVADLKVEVESSKARLGKELVLTATKTHTPNAPERVFDFWNEIVRNDKAHQKKVREAEYSLKRATNNGKLKRKPGRPKKIVTDTEVLEITPKKQRRRKNATAKNPQAKKATVSK